MKQLWKFKFSETRQASGSMDLDVTSPKLLNRKVFLKQLAVDLCTSERRMLFRAQYVSQCLVVLLFERFIKEMRGISSNVSLLGRGSCPPYAATARLSLSDTSITHTHTHRLVVWYDDHLMHASFVVAPDTEKAIERHQRRRVEGSESFRRFQEAVQLRFSAAASSFRLRLSEEECLSCYL